MSPPRRTIAASTALAAGLAAIYLIWEPASQDLAAAVFRTELFSDHGFLTWNNQWYSGHYLLSYSVTYPPLADLLGVRLSAALAVVAGAGLFAALISRRFDGARALVPSLWFAATLAVWLLTGRMPFLLAVPFALGALLPSGLVSPALLAALATLASPVAGLFVALAGAAIGLAGERARGGAIALGALAPMLALNLAFPVGGTEPFVFSAFIAIPLAVGVALWLVPVEYRAVRIAAVLYGVLALGVFVIDNPLGGNVTRLGALAAGPVLAPLLWPRGRWVVLAVSLPLAYWQLVAPVRDVDKGTGDPSTERSFYEPLLAELGKLGEPGTFRVHIPPTKNRWEAAYVARDHPLARGWLRQLESDDFDLFTDGSLSPKSYRTWLDLHAVSYVAVPDAPRDYLSENEVELIDRGLPYLHELWSSEDWRLYEVDVVGLLARGVSVDSPDSFALEAVGPGGYPTGVGWSRYWHVTEGDACVEPDAHDDTTVVVSSPEPERIVIEQRLSLGEGDRC